MNECQSNYFRYYTYISHLCGKNAAIVYGALQSKQRKCENKYFAYQLENLIQDTNLSKGTINNAFKSLQENGFLLYIKYGMPLKKYYKLNL